jgi:hypothetical protein
MSLLSHGSPQPTSAAPRRVTGQYIAKAHLTRRQRVKLAVALSKGAAVVAPLTVKQAAAVMKVSMFGVSKARHNGKRANGHESLAEHIARSTAAERLEAARSYGVDRLWDTMIAPVIAEERASQQAAE